MSSNFKKTATGSLLSAMCSNPNQAPVVLGNAWKGNVPLISAEGHMDRCEIPILKTPNGANIAHDLSRLTHKRLQELDNPLCFNEVREFIVYVLSEEPLNGLGLRLEQEKLTHIGTAKGKIAESALDVCVQAGFYKPIQMPQVRSGRAPR